MSNFLTRIIFGALYIGAIFFCSMHSPLSLLILITIFLGLTLFELITLLQFDNKLYIIGTVLASAYLFYSYAGKFWYAIGFYELHWINFLPAVLYIISLIIIFKRPVELAFDSSKLIFSVVYVTLPFALIMATVRSYDIENFGMINPFFGLFILLWCSDTFAYISGKLFGSTPLSSISQKKTVEGLLGGIFFTIVAGIIINYNFPELRGNWIVVGVLIAIVAPLGDLAESKLKRVFSIKDSGNLFPGHGGFLDRLDSFLISAVTLYVYYLFV